MYSTHTTCPKIKTGNPSTINHTILTTSKKFTTIIPPHKLRKIYTQFTKIIKMSSRLSSTAPLHVNAK